MYQVRCALWQTGRQNEWSLWWAWDEQHEGYSQYGWLQHKGTHCPQYLAQPPNSLYLRWVWYPQRNTIEWMHMGTLCCHAKMRRTERPWPPQIPGHHQHQVWHWQGYNRSVQGHFSKMILLRCIHDACQWHHWYRLGHKMLRQLYWRCGFYHWWQGTRLPSYQ